MFKKLLVPYDFSRTGRQALEYALKLGTRFGAKIHVLHVSELIPPYAVELSANVPLKQLQARLEKVLAELEAKVLASSGKKGKPVSLEITTGVAIKTILQHIKKQKPDLVVVGTHARKGVRHLLLGSTAEKIVRHSPSPVFIVKQKDHWPPKNILFPADFSTTSKQALKEAIRFAKICKAKVDLVHIVNMKDIIPYAQRSNNPANYKEILASVESHAYQEMVRLTKNISSVNIKKHVSEGASAEEIVRFSKKRKNDLIVVPTHGHTGLAHLFMGSTAEAIVRNSKVNVLTFCPEKMKTERRKLIRT